MIILIMSRYDLILHIGLKICNVLHLYAFTADLFDMHSTTAALLYLLLQPSGTINHVAAHCISIYLFLYSVKLLKLTCSLLGFLLHITFSAVDQ